jgi:hypothetical protein
MKKIIFENSTKTEIALAESLRDKIGSRRMKKMELEFTINAEASHISGEFKWK